MIKKNKISEAELEIMKIVWEKQAPAASTEIVRTLKQRCGWEDTTSYTMLSKLVKKGALLRDKQTVSYYSAALSEQEYTLEQTVHLIDKFFSGDSRQLVSMLVENNKISREDIRTLRQFWEEETND